MKQPELVFVPGPGIGHIVSTAEFAKQLLDKDSRLAITILVIRTPITPDVDAYVESLVSSSGNRIRYIILPLEDPPSIDLLVECPENYVTLLIDGHKQCVKETIVKHVLSCSGLVVDFFCTGLIDVANQLNLPTYIFFPSTAGFLGLMLYLPTHCEKFGKSFDILDTEVTDYDIPTYAHPVPASVLPTVVLDKEIGFECMMKHGSRFREVKGLIINTFVELESYAVDTLASDKKNPKVYTVGPLLDLKKAPGIEHENIMSFLDTQPDSSVVFLCFGSMGGFVPTQLVQMAIALERSGQRFLWSVRQERTKEKMGVLNGFSNLDEILPQGFFERTKGRGMICGWAPQVDVLAHQAVGGFVSHCGWNSILESIWHGVPIATWPIYAEQQINAFEMVKDLGLAVELKLDYRSGCGVLVSADKIEKALRSLMDKGNPLRKKVMEMKEKSRKAVVNGGSSFDSMGSFIQDILSKNLH
ncbi:glycosyltransferase [Lithospermum erythrorhizon]|uniref:Glycosyltransferase n=1 Tax=Lithospermum erythrorhizon TaxID=34254 RepID=A0AAV3RLB7_LITER